MKAENFIKWLRIAVKIMTPVSFFLIAGMPGAYWLAGIMFVLVMGLYGYDYFME